MLRVFFREIRIVGSERIPRGVPLVIVGNHVNSLVDPMLLIGFLGVAPRLLAKSTLWRHPVVAPFLFLAGAIPVYRPNEADPAHNLAIFSRCATIVAAGGSVALFPEGTSHNETTLQPLKTGAARIAIAAAQAGAAPGPLILPVGLLYEAKETFRSRVVIDVGHAIAPDLDPRPRQERGALVRALTSRIAAGLAPCVVSYAEWARTQPGRAQQAAGARSDAPVLLLPAALVGLALNWLPYRIPGWIAGRFGSTHDARASYKLLCALLTFPSCWLLESLAAGRLAGVGASVLTAAVAPVTAWAALRYFAPRPATP
jgi:1-acyl-sn-glycerol-3-phosphate acyltransferase